MMDAEKYSRHWMSRKIWTHLYWPKHQLRFKTVARYLRGARCIDVGCATGHSTDILSKLYPAEWTGVDFSPTIIDQAVKFFPGRKFYYAASVEAMPDLVGKFDSVVCSEVIEHVPDDQALINALLSITDQVLILTTPTKRVSDPGHLRIYTEASLAGLLRGAASFAIHRGEPFFYVEVYPK
jgi:2-polyprenyl-3-methyl-5-hydroxy-6-metoxy-1,4-benzoquinol methylase